MGKRFSSDYQPPRSGRGRSQKTIILESIREASLAGLSEKSTKDEAEKAFITHTAKRAFDIDDQNSAMLLKVLWDKGWGSIKSTAPTVNFDFDSSKSPVDMARQVLDASSNGDIPPDIACNIIGAIKSVIDIEANTEIKERLAEIEKQLGLHE